MRRLVTIVTLCMAVLASIPAWGDSPKYHSADPNFDPATACYSVKLVETGLGNSGFSSLTYTLSCSASFTATCVTKNGKNFVQGTPKSGSGQASTQTTLDVRNGQTRGTVTLCPASFTLPDPGCSGSQKLYIISAHYSNCTLDDSLGTASPPLSDLGGDNLFILVP